MTETVRDQVDSIKQRSREADELAREKDKIEERRTRLESKNTQFEELESELEAFLADYRTMSRWRALADEMGADYETDAIEEFIVQAERDLRTVTENEFESFDDASEIRTLRDEFKAHHETLDDIQAEIQQAVDTQCAELSDELATKQTVLRIPDIGSETDERIVNEFESFISYHQNGNLSNDAASRYRELADQYEDVEISFELVQEEYGISDEALTELQELLDSQTRTLAQIDEDALSDLKNLSEFSKLLTIQFKEDD